MRAVSALALLIGCSGPDAAATDTASEPPSLFGDHALTQPGFFNVAHRGGRDLWPEHTMLAYGNAIDAGADVIECDAHASLDGVVMCMHDADLERTTDGIGLLREAEFDALRALDAGYWFTDDEGTTYPHRGSGLQIPTLEDMLSGFPNTPVSIEFKQIEPSIVSKVADLLDAQAAWDRVTLMSFFDTPILDIRERQPDALTALTTIEGLDFLEAGDGYVAPGHHLHAPTNLGGLEVSPELLDKAHAAGIRVWMWTINDAEEMQDLMDMGADGIYTDDPVLLESLL
jgi:glycerophosphoryl diester phosphodiesterase